MPLSVKLAACLDALGLLGEEIEWEHTIALGLRPYNPETKKYDPDEHDPRYIRPMRKPQHKLKTFGDHVPLSGDVSKIAKLDRIEKEQAAFRARLLAKETGEPVVKRKAWPKRPFPKRPRS